VVICALYDAPSKFARKVHPGPVIIIIIIRRAARTTSLVAPLSRIDSMHVEHADITYSNAIKQSY